MKSTYCKATSRTAICIVTALLLGAAGSYAQTVNLTASSSSASLPDGQAVPMWGLACGSVVAPATCAALNPNAGTGWSPVLITAPTGSTLTINLTNSLPAPVPTSLVIVGQVGGGLGNAPTRTPSPAHATQGTTWPIAGGTSAADTTFTPPAQSARVQSFGTEVANGATTTLTWAGLRPGTYLIESGTHPSIQGPMGLYGMLVVADTSTTPPTAYPGVPYDATGMLLLSEIDPVQNATVALAVATPGFSETAVWSGAPGACGDPAVHNCYPPAVNFDPRYYLVNGSALDSTHLLNSVASAGSATAGTGRVLLRFVNAGLRMHVPSVVGALTGSPAVSGFSLIAEDGNLLPGTPRVQSEVFLAAGKTYDVMINAPASGAPALSVFDRALSLSTNNARSGGGGGMAAFISVNGSVPAASGPSVVANADSYFRLPGKTLAVSSPAQGVIANDVGVYGVKVVTAPTHGTLTLNPDGTFVYVADASTGQDSFVYQANGTAGPTATVTMAACTGACLGGPPVANGDSYTSNIASRLQISPPGVLANDTDPQGHPLTAVLAGAATGGTVTLNADGSFTAVPSTVPVGAAISTVTFHYNAVNSQSTSSTSAATVTVTFNGLSNLAVSVKDGPTGLPITDYRWIIEEDRTFIINPSTQVNNGPNVPSLGTNFHTSYMPVVASGCVGTVACESGQTVFDTTSGTHLPAVCDVGNGGCRTTGSQQVAVNPSQVHLDPAKRYYISILPGDGANPFNSGAGGPVDLGGGNSRPFSISQDCGPYAPGAAAWDPTKPLTATCGHTMGGAPIAPAQSAVSVNLQETPLATAKISVFVFEDDSPLNGENDAGGGVDILATHEPGLGGFQITLFDDAGGSGDATGQMTYDMFNMPLSNSLAGTIDPATGLNACPISPNSTDGLVGMIVTCPKFESDGKTLSPLAGQAIIANMMPGRYGVVATPGADRIARGEEWLQTNTLDGQKAHDAFIKVGGPSYFQEFGPAGFHVAIGFANPAIINARLPVICNAAGSNCRNSLSGRVTDMRISRTPDQRLYSSGSRDALGFTLCYVSVGDPDGDDFAFTKCDGNGNFSFTGIPDGNWRVTVFDQWNDQIVDGLSTPVALAGGPPVNMGDLPVQQWHTNLYTRTFIDLNGDGVSQDNEPGLALVPINVRFRDGSFSNFNSTDLNGFAGFNEIFPLFNWYVLEADTTRYKQTGVHVVYDAGGPADGTPGGGTSTIAANIANTIESATAHLPTNLRVPGAVYCGNADCTGYSIKNGPGSSSANPSTGRIDPPWFTTEAWQGFIGQSEFAEFGKMPFAANENGGIKGHVVYASTRPFDDPAMLLQLSWEPLVPGVTINLYQEMTAADGTTSLSLIDTTRTSSWDDWAQGFRSDGIPNMNCPGQESTDPFIFTLTGSTQWLNPSTPLPNSSRFKCYDGMHNSNQMQPAPYDGMYQFPSITGRNPATGLPTGTNCKPSAGPTIPGCTQNPVDGSTMLRPGKYVVEVVVPPGYELVKEEDKNILIGDNYIAPVTQQFGGLGSIFILPDQAAINSTYNPDNPQNPTTDLGALPRHEGDTGSVEVFWPCVGQARVVPDYISLFPGSQEVAPFAGAIRNLCDRKEVTLEDQSSALAKFYIFSSTHVAAHFTGIITDDFSSEFDPFSPQFGEKFAVPNLPVSLRDFAGNEISRVFSDQWGFFDGLNYSTWEVNPPNPTGYAPTMMVACMNDPGPVLDTRPACTSPGVPAGCSATAGQMITDPLYNPDYSQFCYEIPFMPGQTQYMDTPVVPTAAFAEGYNPPDCAYPDTTPAIKSVLGTSIDGNPAHAGPWVNNPSGTLTITALGDQLVPNNSYSGPRATTSPFNQKFITRHYGFGSARGTVTIGGVSATINSWSDTTITVNVPGNVPLCSMQQQGTGGARCGQLVITAANGKQSIDTVMITVGGKTPTYVTPASVGGAATVNGVAVSADNAIQLAIDNAIPGDMIMVGPGTYSEMLLMWKPVRLQGVGAASVTINANTHPSGKMDPWRRQVNCLFGLALNGSLLNAGNAYDPTGTYSCSPAMRGAVDPLPLEGIVGWDVTQNGNLAELLQEPTLMGAYEGAAITVLAKGMTLSIDQSSISNEGNFPANSVPLTNSAQDCRFPSNFRCNPSRIDGLTLTDSSQGGGAVFLHGWNHFTEVSNNRIYANAGTLSGGIVVGQGEIPDPTIDASGVQQGYAFDVNVLVHNNSITNNASYGDELFSSTPSAAGGATFCPGSDNYHFNYNWVCGNLSSGDGGGVDHTGFIINGDISRNWILFNQSTNPTIPTHGGGIGVLGAPPDRTLPDGTECGSVTDVDCPPGLSEGTGRGLVIDSNLILGNTAESGSGGGIRLQSVNGQEIARLPNSPTLWNNVTITNNIIANNVAGWDGGGVSLQDALVVNFTNNTVVSNDTTASAGVLFNTIGAPLASVPPPNCDPTLPPSSNNCAPITTSTHQPAGLVSMANTPNLVASLPAAPATVTCPANYPAPLVNGICRNVSYPVLENNLFWQNRAFNINVGGRGPGFLNQQNLVTLVPTLDQTVTGQCVAGASYWDIGVRGDTGPTNHASGYTLNPTFSILTSTAGYGNTNLQPGGPGLASQYCNGARVPPENGGLGFNVPPGVADATLPNPIFNLTPAATVDEGNNWINMTYGPLSLVNPSGVTLGNYSITAGSPAINAAASSGAPNHDFFGTPRPQGGGFDIGAVEFVSGGGTGPLAVVTFSDPTSALTTTPGNTTAKDATMTVTNTGTGPLTLTSAPTITKTAGAPASTFSITGGTCISGAVVAAGGGTCTITIHYVPGTTGASSAYVTLFDSGAATASQNSPSFSGN